MPYMYLLKIPKCKNVQNFTKQVEELKFNTNNAVRSVVSVTISGKLEICFQLMYKVSDSEGKYLLIVRNNVIFPLE